MRQPTNITTMKGSDLVAEGNKPVSRFLSQEEAVAFTERIGRKSVGGGDVALYLDTAWKGNTRFARNWVNSSGDLRTNSYSVARNILGASTEVYCNQIGDVAVEAAVRRAERMLRLRPLNGGSQFREHFKPLTSDGSASGRRSGAGSDEGTSGDDVLSYLVQTVEPYSEPKLFFDTTYNLEAPERLKALKPLVEAAAREKLFAAGYIQAGASGRVVMDTTGRSLYYPYTESQFSLTVRDSEGTGSGWAGVDFADWTRIDAERLAEIAIQKCLRSRNPVSIEPGRYTTVLEPQAVSDIFKPVVNALRRTSAERGDGPFADTPPYSKIGLKVLDDKITISADPMDPDIGFPPFDNKGNVYNPVTWIKNGVLKELSYYRPYGIRELGVNSGLPNSGAYRMSGGDVSMEDMISSTRRGLLVTRFSGLRVVHFPSLLCAGYTRDGLWLIENGKISKAVKNFRFLESPLFIFNNLESLGTPVRVFSPGYPTVVPSAKVHDFSFTSLIDAI